MKKNSLTTTGSVLTAGLSILPVACCLGPLTAALAGLGLVSVGHALEPYATALAVAAYTLMAISFYLTYRRPREADACAPSRVARHQRALLWVAAVLVVTMSLMPYVIGYLPVEWVT